jgi:hypothetical protein
MLLSGLDSELPQAVVSSTFSGAAEKNPATVVVRSGKAFPGQPGSGRQLTLSISSSGSYARLSNTRAALLVR